MGTSTRPGPAAVNTLNTAAGKLRVGGTKTPGDCCRPPGLAGFHTLMWGWRNGCAREKMTRLSRMASRLLLGRGPPPSAVMMMTVEERVM